MRQFYFPYKQVKHDHSLLRAYAVSCGRFNITVNRDYMYLHAKNQGQLVSVCLQQFSSISLKLLYTYRQIIKHSNCKIVLFFLIHQFKHMIWMVKRTVSLIRFVWLRNTKQNSNTHSYLQGIKKRNRQKYNFCVFK